MSGDYTRFTFDPWDNHSGVRMQQGRVLLDADWNELIELLDRRLRAETTDIIGRATVPKETPDGFKIQFAGSGLTIGRGRLYLHGLLAENHGKAPLERDLVLGEQRGTLPLPYTEQPYLPNPPALPTAGPYLVYLDVWQREVTALEEAGLIDPAIGVETAARLQTVWQVKFLPQIPATFTCADATDAFFQANAATSPSAGRLTTGAVGVASAGDPCVLAPNAGYRGVENRLYRVEVHDPGLPGTATFKWSRDNASIATNITALNAARDTLTVVQVGRDATLRFRPGDWVEVTDDFHEFAGQPGEMRKVAQTDDVLLTITLTAPLTAGLFDPTNAARHTRVTRWAQKGIVRDKDQNVLGNVDPTGVITVPATAATSVLLEDGVIASFSVDPAGGAFKTGDFWVFAARTADSSVEVLTAAPPRGILHHYAPLAIVTPPASVTDCRTLWPPATGGSCDCTLCVSVAEHNGGTFTIQQAIDQLKPTGGKICLEPGFYLLNEGGLRFDGSVPVTLQGRGWMTVLIHRSALPAIRVQNSLGVTLEEFTVLDIGNSAGAGGFHASILLANSVYSTVRRCLVLQTGNPDTPSLAIALQGILLETRLKENTLIAPFGVGEPGSTAKGTYLISADLFVEDNLLWTRRVGVQLTGLALHAGQTRIAGNTLVTQQTGAIITGFVPAFGRMDLLGNEIITRRTGLMVGVDNARIAENDILVVPDRDAAQFDGISLTVSPLTGAMQRCQILANRILNPARYGIGISNRLASARIAQNFIEGAGQGGIVMTGDAIADDLCIEQNQILRTATAANMPPVAVYGIRALRAREAKIVHNTVHNLGTTTSTLLRRVGIQAVACFSVQIADNDLMDIGPNQEFSALGAGIEVGFPFDTVEVNQNVVRRRRIPLTNPDGAAWIALRIERETAGVHVFGPDTTLVVTTATDVFLFTPDQVIKLPTGRERVSVRGNLLDAYGSAPAADVAGRGTLIFGENRCLMQNRGVLTARLNADSMIVSANSFEGNYTPNDFAVEMTLLSGSPTAPPLYTFPGNITNGQVNVMIGLAQVGLSAVWTPLTVFLP